MNSNKEWFIAREIAAMKIPGLPHSTRGVEIFMKREGVKGNPKLSRLGRGGYRLGRTAWEYHVSVIQKFGRGQNVIVHTLLTATDSELIEEVARRFDGKKIIIRVPANMRYS
ncbi:hypothetical protein [Brucella inopinata]|uniref:hypothetical protein n=1 Tax=Brucella inopinata TaxID=1218315 RepID=UPI00046D3347|nr:hypothetical protein [Brucella inopinata]KEY05910.1 hypothetical protein IL59_0200830 [Brucella suis bv. 4 str. 40]